MNCREFEKLLFTLARQPWPDQATGVRGLSHADACAQCAARLLEARLLVAGVRAVKAELNREATPARVEAALLDAFRKRPTTAVVVLPGKSTAQLAHWKPLALAAGVLILFSLVVFSWQQASGVVQKPKAAATPPVPASGPEAEAPAISDVSPATTAPLARRPKPRAVRQPDARPRKTESVTKFFSLMEGEEFEVPESGQIVRIELSSAALLEVGLPVDLAMASAPIKADVVLGEDGMARAIRFVRQ